MTVSPPLLARRALAGLAASAVAAASMLSAAALPVAAAEPDVAVAPAAAALDWLAGEVVANDGMLTVTFGTDTYPDPGLTLDALVALAAGGQGSGPAIDAAAASLPLEMGDYITGFAGGTARAAGATAKTLFTEEVLGRDLSPAYDLEADLRSLMATDGAHPGRFQDVGGFDDYSNGLSQALGVLALARTGGGVPAEAVAYLLAQQCSDGSFLLYFGDTGSCDDPAGGDADATAFALMALLAAPASAPATDAIDDAAAHLLTQQQASGGFFGTGAVNANTTGVAAAALRAAGETAGADAGAGFLASLQHTSSCADLGALAYDEASFAGGLTDRSQWLRATAQGALGLGLPAYGGIGTVAPVDAGLDPVACTTAPGPVDPPPVAPVDPTVSLAGLTVTVGGQLSGTASGFEPGESVTATLYSSPRTLGSVAADADGRIAFSFPVPADLEPGVHRLELVGQRSGRTVSVDVEVLGVSAPGTLPATGAGTGEQAAVAVALLAAGTALVRRSRRTTAPDPLPVAR